MNIYHCEFFLSSDGEKAYKEEPPESVFFPDVLRGLLGNRPRNAYHLITLDTDCREAIVQNLSLCYDWFQFPASGCGYGVYSHIIYRPISDDVISALRKTFHYWKKLFDASLGITLEMDDDVYYLTGCNVRPTVFSGILYLLRLSPYLETDIDLLHQSSFSRVSKVILQNIERIPLDFGEGSWHKNNLDDLLNLALWCENYYRFCEVGYTSGVAGINYDAGLLTAGSASALEELLVGLPRELSESLRLLDITERDADEEHPGLFIRAQEILSKHWKGE